MRTLPFVQMTSMSAPSDALKLQTEDARQHRLFKNHLGTTRSKPVSDHVNVQAISTILGSIEENQLKNYTPQGKLPP